MKDGGWYMCSSTMHGKFFGIFGNTVIKFVEIAIYSQEFVQLNVSSP
jgi:hypothetical protein